MAKAEKHSFTSARGKESSSVHNPNLHFFCHHNIQLESLCNEFSFSVLNMAYFSHWGENCAYEVGRFAAKLGKGILLYEKL
jgi:hypothetical protein